MKKMEIVDLTEDSQDSVIIEEIVKPPCPLGDQCFHRGAHHFATFKHCNDNEETEKPACLEETEKPVCPLQDRCYRKNVYHFKTYKHEKLEKLAKILGERDPLIPPNFILNVSHQTLKEQLNILKDLNRGLPASENFGVKKRDSSFCTLKNEKTLDTRCKSLKPRRHLHRKKHFCTLGNLCYRKNIYHFQEYYHEHLETILREIGRGPITVPDDYIPKTSYKTLIEQLDFLRQLKETNLGHEYKLLNGISGESTVIKKLLACEPYNFFLTSLREDIIRPEHDPLSLSFQDLFDESLGKIASTLHINCNVDLNWLFSQYAAKGIRSLPTTVLYSKLIGEEKILWNLKCKKIADYHLKMHNAKMMVISYGDDSIRIIVMTANLVESDWKNCTQGLWISPLCPKLVNDEDTLKDSMTNFKRDLLRFLNSIESCDIDNWINTIKRCDLSSIKVFLITSVPTVFMQYPQFALGRDALQEYLEEYVIVDDKENYPVIIQCTKLGKVGCEPQSWIFREMADVFWASRSGLPSHLDLKIVFPSMDDFANSFLHSCPQSEMNGAYEKKYSKKTHEKQLWLENYLHVWRSNKRRRSKALPGIKSYCRVSENCSKMLYFLLTSANFGQATWGNHMCMNKCFYESYELGILFLPQVFFQRDYFPLRKEEADQDFPMFPLHFDLPLTRYRSTDKPLTKMS